MAISNSDNQQSGGGGAVTGAPTTPNQTKVGLIVAIILGVLVVGGAVAVYFVK